MNNGITTEAPHMAYSPDSDEELPTLSLSASPDSPCDIALRDSAYHSSSSAEDSEDEETDISVEPPLKRLCVLQDFDTDIDDEFFHPTRQITAPANNLQISPLITSRNRFDDTWGLFGDDLNLAIFSFFNAPSALSQEPLSLFDTNDPAQSDNPDGDNLGSNNPPDDTNHTTNTM